MTVSPGFSNATEERQFCYLTTTGRITGRPHRIEIWFAVVDGSLYVISGAGRRSDWVMNLLEHPELVVEVGSERWDAQARVLPSGEHPARQRLAERYQGWQAGRSLSDWAREGLLIEISLIQAP